LKRACGGVGAAVGSALLLPALLVGILASLQARLVANVDLLAAVAPQSKTAPKLASVHERTIVVTTALAF